MSIFIVHPATDAIVCCKPLLPGDRVQAGDLFGNSAGKWEVCLHPGIVLQPGVQTVWLRPALD